jgi:hypothetical protein
MTGLTLCEITRRALVAVDAGDLDDLARALEEREAAMAAASPEEQAVALSDGAILGLRLAEIKHSLVAQYGRLAQIREGFANQCGSFSGIRPVIDVRG